MKKQWQTYLENGCAAQKSHESILDDVLDLEFENSPYEQ